MSCWLAVLLIATTTSTEPRSAAFERDGVRIEASIRSQIYTWTVTNVDGPPIQSFEVGQHYMYNAVAPTGWQIEIDGDRIRASTDRAREAITAGRSKSFQARRSSSGGTLGAVPCVVGLEGDDEVVFDGVWGVIPEPRSIVLLVMGTLIAIAFAHTLLVVRRERRASVPTRGRPAPAPRSA